jgi:hypothetical protein
MHADRAELRQPGKDGTQTAVMAGQDADWLGEY